MVHSTKEREREQDLENMVDTVKHPSLAPSFFPASDPGPTRQLSLGQVASARAAPKRRVC